MIEKNSENLVKFAVINEKRAKSCQIIPRCPLGVLCFQAEVA